MEGTLANTAAVRAPALPLIGKSLNLSDPQFPHDKMGTVPHLNVVRNNIAIESFLKCQVLANGSCFMPAKSWQ